MKSNVFPRFNGTLWRVSFGRHWVSVCVWILTTLPNKYLFTRKRVRLDVAAWWTVMGISFFGLKYCPHHSSWFNVLLAAERKQFALQLMGWSGKHGQDEAQFKQIGDALPHISYLSTPASSLSFFALFPHKLLLATQFTAFVNSRFLLFPFFSCSPRRGQSYELDWAAINND